MALLVSLGDEKILSLIKKEKLHVKCAGAHEHTLTPTAVSTPQIIILRSTLNRDNSREKFANNFGIFSHIFKNKQAAHSALNQPSKTACRRLPTNHKFCLQFSPKKSQKKFLREKPPKTQQNERNIFKGCCVSKSQKIVSLDKKKFALHDFSHFSFYFVNIFFTLL